MFNSHSQRLIPTIQARGLPITFISFSISPSHSDTKGTVNGFQTGSSVYLITWGWEQRDAVTMSISTGRDQDKAGTHLQK